jgi:hypothetical protein
MHGLHPGDPLHPLKAYDNIGAFTEHLTTRLCAVEYRQFFSQFVPLSEQDGFYSKLKTLLDPGGNYTPDQDFDAAKKSKITEQGHYGHHWSDLWYESAVKRVCFIMDNVSSSAVSTADITKRATTPGSGPGAARPWISSTWRRSWCLSLGKRCWWSARYR